MLQFVDADVLAVKPGGGVGIELFYIVVELQGFVPGHLGIGHILFGAALIHMEQMLGIVADALQVVQCLVDPVDIHGLLGGQLMDIEFHQIVADGIGEVIDDGFVFRNGLGVADLIVQHPIHGQADVLPHQLAHPVHLAADLQQGNAGVAHQVHVDEFQPGGILVLLLGNQLIGELYHQVGAGQQDDRGNHLEEDVHHRHLEHGVRDQPLHQLGIGQEHGDQGHDHAAHHVVDQINHGGPLGIVPGAHGGQDGGHGGADVDTADEIRGKVQRHQSLERQGLQNTHGSRGGLNHRTNQRAHQDTQNGALGTGDKILEPSHLAQGLHGAAHGVQALEQKAKAQNDLTDVLDLGLFGIEHHKGAHANAERSNAGHIQGDENAGDGGTDVGTEDDAGGLSQVHDAGVDKAHDHHGGSGGRLNHDGDKHAQQKAQKAVSGELFQQILHL